MSEQEINKEIDALNKRKDMCLFQIRISTTLLTKVEYECEIDAIDRRLESLNYKLLGKNK